MDRRDFLRKAGVGSVALASAPGLVRGLLLGTPAGASASDQVTNWNVAAFSGSNTDPKYRIALEAKGVYTPNQIVGDGSYTIFDNSTSPPKRILSSGTLKVKRMISQDIIGSWGAFVSGTLVMHIDLVQDTPEAAVVPATIHVTCNIPPGGLFTPHEEGFELEIPSFPYGRFVPLMPIFGGSVFSHGVQERN